MLEAGYYHRVRDHHRVVDAAASDTVPAPYVHRIDVAGIRRQGMDAWDALMQRTIEELTTGAAGQASRVVLQVWDSELVDNPDALMLGKPLTAWSDHSLSHWHAVETASLAPPPLSSQPIPKYLYTPLHPPFPHQRYHSRFESEKNTMADTFPLCKNLMRFIKGNRSCFDICA